uniref:CDP-Ethanolamine:DAG ethanolamine phosphotransferase n=1 Tax=Chlamydomonas euryale TaxID=1486919 RepID=A0A7R9YWU4_9CHLO|mmetsp:Transcript_31378/g.93665  ORF Transcript_31378/g.93665 Transcript_31378/m.93665 type:complete len:393 (+) Transcript_31378:195-1373(+)
MPYLSQRALSGIAHYKYKSTGYTFLDVVHTPVWNFVVARLPMWLAPNLITLTGLMCVFASFGIDALYIMDYEGVAVPSWVYVFRSLAVILYVNLDCIDGKQARRTGCSSPLGQLFDHGCDALSVRLLLDSCHATLDYPCSWTSAVIVNLVMLPWILAHWEEYHTGNLNYGNGYFGVLESNYALCVVHFSGYFFGNSFWTVAINGFLPFQLPFTIVVRHLYFAAFVIGALSQVAEQVNRMLAHKPHELPVEERGHKELGQANMLKHLFGILAMLALGVVATSDGGGGYGNCRMMSVTYGMMYALVASGLIVAHMAKEPVPVFYWAYALLLLGALNHEVPFVSSRVAAGAMLAVAAAGYLHYVVSVVNQICDELGIRCFLITPRAAPSSQSKEN